jgi:5'-3' exonuclease
MQPLIDGDILLYEIGFAAEAGWQQAGFPSFDYVAELLHNRIGNICAITESTAPPILFITGKTNFRNDIAKRTPYKERPSNKPWHYKNLKAYIPSVWDTRCTEGLEADDLMSIEQCRRPGETIICTRDKDLRMVPGWHYGWELGNQPQFGPFLVENAGRVSLSTDRKSIKGEGLLFFYSQCLTGDKVDTIPGLDGCGAVGASKILDGCVDPLDAFRRVRGVYKNVYGDKADEYLLETGRLLWMTRELHEDGSPVLWEFPNE